MEEPYQCDIFTREKCQIAEKQKVFTPVAQFVVMIVYRSTEDDDDDGESEMNEKNIRERERERETSI